MHLKWDYIEQAVRISMDGYVEQALKEFKHDIPKQKHYGPSKMERPNYGQKIQYAKVDHSAALPPQKIEFLQQVTGKFLFYARAVDNTMMRAFNDIASSIDVESTCNATVYFLNYAACNPDAEIIYRASDMILQANSNATYLVSSCAWSQASKYYFLGNTAKTQFNGSVLIPTKIIKNVMASAAEAKVAALYLNA